MSPSPDTSSARLSTLSLRYPAQQVQQPQHEVGFYHHDQTHILIQLIILLSCDL